VGLICPQKLPFKLPDAFQAAIARIQDIVFVTRDAGDFGQIEEVAVSMPYRI